MNIQHTFALCAYKESPYIEECIKSLLNQTIKSHIILCTSTPSDFIFNLANKYKIPYFINSEGKEEKTIGQNWNFAYKMTKTQFVTITHQDDIYCPTFLEEINKYLNSNSILCFTNSKELRNKQIVEKNTLLNIKNLMNYPLRFKILQNMKLCRRIILSFGNPLCCPSVTLNKAIVGKQPFNESMKSSLDWEAWYKLSQKKGAFIYIPKRLVIHRISEESTTTNTIANGMKVQEDYEMFCKYWPKAIAKIIFKFYSKSMASNKM